MQLINENSGQAMLLLAIEFKNFVLTIYKLLVLPFESKWQWPLHVCTSLVSLVWNICLVVGANSVGLAIILMINSISATLTLVTTSPQHVFMNLNIIWLFVKALAMSVSLIVEGIMENRIKLMEFYGISLVLELISGPIYIYYLNKKMNADENVNVNERSVESEV